MVNAEMNSESCKGVQNGKMELEVPEVFSSRTTLERRQVDDTSVYDPFKERNHPHPNSTLGSFFHLLKSSLGTGLLATPVAFKNSGLIAGTIGTVLVAWLAAHCVHILVKTSHELCRIVRRPSLDYSETCEEVFRHGPKALQPYTKTVSTFVTWAMAGVCLGGTSVYVIFIATSLKDILDFFVPERRLSVQVHCALTLLPLILLLQLRHLKFLAPVSFVANAMLLITFAITSVYMFSDLPDIRQRTYVAGVLQWPLFMSTAIFAMESINVVMPVENEMKHPQHFLGCAGVLSASMSLVCVLYTVMGFVGYWKYGDQVLGSVTLNLPQEDTLAQVAKLLVALSVLLTYCLQMYAPMDIIWNKVRHRLPKQHHNLAQVAMRTSSVCLTVALATAVPDLELLIGLVGAVFLSTLGILVPVVVETVHRWDRDLSTGSLVLWKNVILLLFYFVVLVSGVHTAVQRIVNKYWK